MERIKDSQHSLSLYIKLKYPLKELEELSTKLQKLLAEERKKQYAALDFKISFEDRGKIYNEATTNLMNKAGTELLPKINRVLGQIEAILHTEDESAVKNIVPLLNEIKDTTTYPTNPLRYADLSSKLSLLAGYLSAQIVLKPTVFVGHRYTDEDDKIAEKFITLFGFEGLECITGKPAKPKQVDEKVQGLISKTDGTIIIFSRDKKLENSEYWTTSDWLVGELSFAMGKEKPYLIFYDECIDPEERGGMHGTYEYIPFNRECLDDSLLKAIPYLREFRQRILNVGD
jgi:hypothetical protein